jgi:hemolysin activation/secretion protein
MKGSTIMKYNNKIAISMILASSLFAQTTPNISSIEKNIEPEDKKFRDNNQLIEINGMKDYTPPMKSLSAKTVFVKSFNIDGAIHISSDDLLEKISSYKNRDLNFDDLQKVTSIITKSFRDKGYFVSRAYLPKQDIIANNGIVNISIIEGNYGDFILKNNSIVKDSTVQSLLDHAKRDNIVSTHTLERSMLIINDTPGVVVTQADVKPGTKVGTSDFIIGTQASDRYDGYIIADNYGSRYTGEYRVLAGVDINSPISIGDKLLLSTLLSEGTNLINTRAAYNMLLHPSGLRGEIAYSDTSYSLVKEYKDLDAVGRSKTFEATFIYPVIRTRLENLDFSLNIVHKDLSDEIRSTSDITDKRIIKSSLKFAYNKDSLLFKKYDSKTLFNISYTYGNLEFDDILKETADKNGANTTGNYAKIAIDLGKKVVLNNNLTLETFLKYQHALGNKNLDGSEDISIGGSSGVKLYPDGESSAENGYLASIEFKYKLPEYNGLSNSIGLFYDIGKVNMNNNTNVIYDSKSLQDAGISYYANYKDFFLKTHLAFKVGNRDITSEPDNDHQLLLQAGWQF